MDTPMARTTRGPGSTAEARVRWALRFRDRDLTRISPTERDRLWRTLCAWEGRPPLRNISRPADDGIAMTQLALREAIEAFANGLPDQIVIPERTIVLFPPRRRRRGERTSGRIVSEAEGNSLSPTPATPGAV